MSLPVKLHLLPPRTGGAAENMAADFLLLRRYPDSGHARFRAYGWHRPAFTFGYSQKLAAVRLQVAALAGDEPVELCRRPTGGGLVDHRADWTYALVLPRGHALEAARAVESYRAIHAALAAALTACGQPATLNEKCPRDCTASPAPADEPDDAPRQHARPGPARPGAAGPATVSAASACFVQPPELHDVIVPGTSVKLAGAAQKRTKEGLLLQGSIARAAVTAPRFDWESFGAAFVAGLASTLAAPAEERPWPEFPEGEHEALTESYAAPEWLELR